MYVTMTCQIVSSNPEIPEIQKVSWLKDDKPLTQQQMLMEKEGLTLILYPVTKDMRGQYRCEARNTLGTGKSEPVTFQVHCELLCAGWARLGTCGLRVKASKA